jgi:hypothetical protein
MLQWIPRSWRAWLKQTQLPGLRQFVALTRLGIQLKRLGTLTSANQILQMQSAIDYFAAQHPLIAHRFDTIEGRVHHLECKLDHLEGRIYHVASLHKHLCEQTDLLKSSGEVPTEWFEEFRCWKEANPVPQSPLVSVCVATWNRAHVLTQRCLPSLMRQTYPHLEIVVVGDACTDDTEQRIAALGDRRIRFVNLPQRGRYPAERKRCWMVAGTVPINHGLSLCSGDFITHLDDDDEHDPTRLEKLVAFVRLHDLDFVWHPFWYERSPGQWDLHACEELRLGQVTTSSIFYRRWLARIGWDINAHLLAEPGDWNRLRKFLYLGVNAQRFPEPLLRHYAEGSHHAAAA